MQWLSQLTAEVRFQAGIYWFRERAQENNSPEHFLFGVPLGEGDYPRVVNTRRENNRIENTASAAYAQLGWTPPVFDRRWELELGLRHSRDRRQVQRDVLERNWLDQGHSVAELTPDVVFNADGDRRFSDTSWLLSASYDWQENALVFLRLVEAYRSGGFNVRDPDPDFFEQGFDEEKLRSLEAGLKSQWAGGALRFNATAFHSRFRDYQLNFQIPGTISGTRVFNSGKARVQGLELELTAIPAANLLVSLNYAYLDADIDPTENPFTGERQVFGFTNAPPHSASANINWTVWHSPRARWAILTNIQYTGNRIENNPATDRDAYTLIGIRAGLFDLPVARGTAEISLWAQNVLDERYVAFAMDNLPHAGRATLWGEPRRYGIDLRWRFP